MTLILNNDEIQKALKIGDALAVMEETYRELAASRAVNCPVSQTYLPHSMAQTSYSFKSVNGGVKKLGVLALRITSDILCEKPVDNVARLEKLPLAGNGQYVGLVQLFSVETGELLAIMPDGFLQQTRVGITSALGAKTLARENSEVLALIGSGGQARAHFRFMTAVRPIKRVKIYSPNPEHRRALAAQMERETEIPAEAVESAETAVTDCDIVCSATNSSRPVISAKWLQPGMHYNSIREFEMDEAALEKSDIVAIHSHFAGYLHCQPPGTVKDLPGLRREKARDWSRYPEIQDLIVGKASGRTSDKQITFFLNNVGTGVQFAAMGYAAYRACKEKGLGKEIPTDWFLQDIKP
jgi:ornithine cyclodeaminase/alanine dehydrogenase-like protein (mu-crystallin family)